MSHYPTYTSGMYQDHGYRFLEHFRYDETLLSSVYLEEASGTVLIVDSPEIFTTEFPYKLYCKHQNEYMARYDRVIRILNTEDDVAGFFGQTAFESSGYMAGRTFDRSSLTIDPSPLEWVFEVCFEMAFGADALKYLQREYPVYMENGRTAYMDYALFHRDGNWLAIEENGIQYHHPFIIKEQKYRVILAKQNAVANQNGRVFRWDTASLLNREQIVDELKEFVGPLSNYLVQHTLSSTRSFSFLEYQADSLHDLSRDRENGKDSALIVLPTGTGKTRIAVEDMRRVLLARPQSRFLVLVPTRDMVQQWEGVVSRQFSDSVPIEVLTYAAIARRYKQESADAYDYILVDEAHHAAAPVLRKVIRHYQPGFLLGMTATDQRLDARRLEEVFSEYEVALDLREAIEQGYLAPVRAFRLQSNIDLSRVQFNGRDFVNAQLERSVRVLSRNELIADCLHTFFHERLPGKSGIVFCVNVAHAKEMAGLLRSRGMAAASVDGSDPERFRKTADYMDGKTQFLCTCSLLTEGWDAPHTSVIVMARPTMSKVLYMQQIGRGTRLHPDKEALYVIDVVDCYGSFGSVSNRPWSLHSLFDLQDYRAFADLFPGTSRATGELELLGTTHEQLIKLDPFDLFTMQKAYEDYLSPEQLARELFVSTGTVNSWVKKGDIEPAVIIPMGRSKLMYFHPDSIEQIRKKKGLKEHSEETIVQDFWDFIEQGTYTFSYKIFFILALIQTVDASGEADIDRLVDCYRGMYQQRLDAGQPVDRPNCPYNERSYLQDTRVLTRSMLENPFEKFERKRFLYYCKDLSKISFHHSIWQDLQQNDGLQKLKDTMQRDMESYYESL